MDENWSGNRHVIPFGGYRAMGGEVRAGFGYVVGERGREFFQPQTNGTIIPNHQLTSGGVSEQTAKQLIQAINLMNMVSAQHTEAVEAFTAKFGSIPEGELLQSMTSKNPAAVADAVNSYATANPLYAENFERNINGQRW